MLTFLTENLATIIIAIIVAGILTAIIVKMIKDKKKGKSSCGCGCENCAASEICHKKDNTNEAPSDEGAGNEC